MKGKIAKENPRRTRKILEIKFCCRNLIKGINARVVLFLRHSRPFLKLTRVELQPMDQKTRKLMMMHKALHPRDDIDRLYASRKEGKRGLASIEDSVDASIRRLDDCIKKSKERLITAVNNITDNIMIHRTTISRKQKCKEKQLYWYLNRQTGENTQKELDIAKKGKHWKINWISSNSNTKQRHKDQLY